MLALALILTAVQPVRPPVVQLPSPTGHLAYAKGVLSPPMTGELPSAAQRFVDSKRAELGLAATDGVSVEQAMSSRFGATIQLGQRVHGLEVFGARVNVTFDGQRQVVRLASSIRPYTQVSPLPLISGPQALAIAAKQIEYSLLDASGQVQGGHALKAFFVGDALHAGYLVWVPTLRTTENWHAAVDAITGEVLWLEDRARFASNTAKVYEPNPGGLNQGVGVAPLKTIELTHLLPDAGRLEGDFIRAWGCCPTQGCAADAGSKRATGAIQTFQGTFNYDVAICDRVQRATNEVAEHPSGDFVYTPVDPPTTQRPSFQSLADSDPFAEVHAYHHVTRIHDYVGTLSSGPFAKDAGVRTFQFRDLARGQRPSVWVNPAEPDFNAGTQNAQGTIVSNVLGRVDNAVFMARELMQLSTVPEYAFTTDALVMYQGNRADYAYDAPVVWHETGHGVVYSTANWTTSVRYDARSANNESSALHEGVADVFAFMVGNESKLGTYTAPRSPSSSTLLRDAANTFKCPDVLWGESHQDSQHFAGALWQARSTLFKDAQETFDAAFYAGLISFPPNVHFELAAEILSASVGQAFKNDPMAEAKMKAIFDARGVSNCSKVLDVTDLSPKRRDVYIIPGADFTQVTVGEAIPGPYQMKFRVPNGARSVTVSGPYFGGGGGGSTPPTLLLLAKANAPVTFVRTGTNTTHDADRSVVPTRPAQGQMSATAMIDVPCGGELYFTVANTSRRDRQLTNLAFSYEPALECPPPVPDAGPAPVDAGPSEPEPIFVPGVSADLGAPLPAGCGCSSAGPGLLALVGLGALRRRRR